MRQRTVRRRAIGIAALLGLTGTGLLLVRPTQSSAVQGAQLVRGNKPGEWRYWGGDAWSSRYSALDQINASNFNSLQIAWQWNGGDARQRRVLSDDADLRERPPVHRRDHAARRRRASTRRLARRSGSGGSTRAFAGRRRRGSSRGAASRTGPTATSERVIVVTPGYHLASLDAKTGTPDPKFGKNGVVDLMDGLGLPLVPLAVDDTGSLIISDAAPARKAKPGEKWDPVTKTGADGTIGIDPSLRSDREQLAGASWSAT